MLDVGSSACSAKLLQTVRFLTIMTWRANFNVFLAVPNEYFQHLDHTGQRMDKYERPELVLGTYEMVATTDYCRNNTLPKPPAIIFVIDVSYNNIKSGLVHLLCAHMKEIIQNLPVDQGHEKSNMRVGFITYNSSVHFYNIKVRLLNKKLFLEIIMFSIYLKLRILNF